MSGYTRVYNKATGNAVEAGDFNTEYQSVADAFSQTSGHKHDGTTAEGAYVTTVSGVSNNNAIEIDEAGNEIDFFIDVSSVKTQQIKLVDGAILPVTDDDIDLGSATFEFKDLYIDGTANIDTAVIGGLTLTTGTLGGSDIVTLAATQTLTSKTLTSPTINGPVIDVLDDSTFTGSIQEETYTLAGLSIDPANGTIQTKTLSAPVTLTAALTDGEYVTLHILNGDTYAVTWPTITWITGIPPGLGTKHVVELWYVGSTLFGANVGAYS